MSTTMQNDIVSYGLTQAGAQLSACFEGLNPEFWTTKVAPSAMSAAETAEHLCEVYEAFKKMSIGQDHEWGNYSSGISDQRELLEHMNKLRGEAVAIANGSDKPETAKGALDYLIGHDFYHVGQLVLTRMSTDPGWDPYSIYGGS